MASRIGTLLIICGPSAGGKSTLIDQLRDGSLASEVVDALPAQASEWPLVEGNDILKRDRTLDEALPDGERLDGILLHYDLIHLLRVGYSDTWFDDPAFGLLDLSESAIFCDVRPEPDILVEHFEVRAARDRARPGPCRGDSDG